MKHAAAVKGTADILLKIETIEREVMDLKLSVLNKMTSSAKKNVKLKGIFKGLNVTDKDIASAKKSLYGKTGI